MVRAWLEWWNCEGVQSVHMSELDEIIEWEEGKRLDSHMVKSALLGMGDSRQFIESVNSFKFRVVFVNVDPVTLFESCPIGIYECQMEYNRNAGLYGEWQSYRYWLYC